jgi:LPS export ABC transporter protein LptC
MINISNRYNIFSAIARSIFPGILFCTLLASCTNDPKEIDALVGKGTAREDVAHDVTLLVSENGHMKTRLFAKEFVRNDVAKPPYIDMRKSVRVEFFNDSLQVESVLTAKYARYYERQGNILIRDSVTVLNKKGERLNTEELVWNQNIRKIFTEKFVRIITPTQIIYGNGLEANEDFTWYKILNPTGIVQVNKTDLPE